MLLGTYFLSKCNLLRISEEEEIRGIDYVEHGGNAYNIVNEKKVYDYLDDRIRIIEESCFTNSNLRRSDQCQENGEISI